MKYISTRGQAPALGFEDVLLTGLASDGGLYVPEYWPQFTLEEIATWRGLSYAELAEKIITPFVGEAIPQNDLRQILHDTYQGFDHSAVAPLTQLDSNQWVLELFHGPTLAFKDFALQLLGRLLDYLLARRSEKAVIVGATSGDTGSAAIEGCRHCDNVDIFILHPHQRVSEVQRRQMTTVVADNVHNLAVQGNFDDCQAVVKACFQQQDFLQGKARLVAVNSINWARIMAQVVYYFYAALAVGAPQRSVAFSVPTGNFGDIYAGYVARNMGLPISQLLVATNRNDILHRFMANNQYSKEDLSPTLSPSMDIMVSSNFERLLFDMYGRDGAAIDQLMTSFQQQGTLTVEPWRWELTRQLFDSCSVTDEETCQTIGDAYRNCQYKLDPHSAIGVRAAMTCQRDQQIPMITLATAHPVKFPEAVVRAGLSSPELPDSMADLYEREERYTVIENELAVVQSYVAKYARPLN
ncbi:threonine synthase [Zooshikella marina]|uniref:threonine synthase n=1 Tax=Zooshikella ganghwensis TaxID=202772 RepID=UPI001BAF32A3|nr:threonine synthase [Zooshikella ganghwensis]MBU2705707.1 threonine synthase [Zooshikella ganghwensis]